jgi:glycosyltransferase involved in cell wall biosynthesis
MGELRTAAVTSTGSSLLHLIVPDSIDDAVRPSGGNIYDRRLRDRLVGRGWHIQQHLLSGAWPAGDKAALAAALSGGRDGSAVLVDGLIASDAPEVIVPAARRLRLSVLVHMPLGLDAGDRVRARESAVLSAAATVIATSEWTASWLAGAYGLGRVRVAIPGVDPASLAPPQEDGSRLLCVGAVSRHKGHDVLCDALRRVAARPWRCTCAGSLDREPDLAARLARQAATGLPGRIRWTGPLDGGDLAAVYHDSDLLVLPSRAETYGMVITEALARGLPVIASNVGGTPEALGAASGGDRPGLLVSPGDAAALAAALGSWLTDARLRARLRRAAVDRREALTGWDVTVERIATALAEPASLRKAAR